MIRQYVSGILSSSRNLDRTQMYPGKHVFTWAKANGMPWVLLSITPCED